MVKVNEEVNCCHHDVVVGVLVLPSGSISPLTLLWFPLVRSANRSGVGGCVLVFLTRKRENGTGYNTVSPVSSGTARR